jgi:hypothetical protein
MVAYSDNYYCLEGLSGWAPAEYRECLERPDDLFQPLFAAHPELEAALAALEGGYPWCPGAGLHVRSANVSRARESVEASLRGEAGECDDSDRFTLEVLLDVADLLRYAEPRGLGLIERCA